MYTVLVGFKDLELNALLAILEFEVPSTPPNNALKSIHVKPIFSDPRTQWNIVCGTRIEEKRVSKP